MHILLDMDGVIADFERGFLRIWQKQHPEKIHIPLEERNSHFIVDQYPKEYKELINQIMTSPGFFLSLEPVDGSIQAINELKTMGAEIFICTTPLSEYKNCVLEKYEWIEKHLGFEWTKKIILTTDKTLIKGDYLIDDQPQIIGVDTPTWEHIIYDLPKNRFAETKKRLSWQNWKNVIPNLNQGLST